MGREIRQQIVKTHFKKRLVKDPTKELTGSLKNKVREQIKEFFSKAHKKYVKHKAETDAKRKSKGMPSGTHTPPGEPPTPADDVDKADEEPHFSDDEASPTISSGQLSFHSTRRLGVERSIYSLTDHQQVKHSLQLPHKIMKLTNRGFQWHLLLHLRRHLARLTRHRMMGNKWKQSKEEHSQPHHPLHRHLPHLERLRRYRRFWSK
jgi:hypothetical protein